MEKKLTKDYYKKVRKVRTIILLGTLFFLVLFKNLAGGILFACLASTNFFDKVSSFFVKKEYEKEDNKNIPRFHGKTSPCTRKYVKKEPPPQKKIFEESVSEPSEISEDEVQESPAPESKKFNPEEWYQATIGKIQELPEKNGYIEAPFDLFPKGKGSIFAAGMQLKKEGIITYFSIKEEYVLLKI